MFGRRAPLRRCEPTAQWSRPGGGTDDSIRKIGSLRRPRMQPMRLDREKTWKGERDCWKTELKGRTQRGGRCRLFELPNLLRSENTTSNRLTKSGSEGSYLYGIGVDFEACPCSMGTMVEVARVLRRGKDYVASGGSKIGLGICIPSLSSLTVQHNAFVL